MLWKLLRLQALLDSLFDEDWLCLGPALEPETLAVHETNAPLQQA